VSPHVAIELKQSQQEIQRLQSLQLEKDMELNELKAKMEEMANQVGGSMICSLSLCTYAHVYIRLINNILFIIKDV
jgi:hypothetical protein